MTQAYLSQAPDTITSYKEIAVVYNDKLPDLWNQLTPQERVFMYYLFRASLPGNRICADQIHRHTVQIKELCELILEQKDILLTAKLPFDAHEFIDNITTYLVYLWTNHSQYFIREDAEEKRTPQLLGLNTFTKENFVAALDYLGHENSRTIVDEIEQSLFDRHFEPTATIPNSIEQSAVNFYSPDFTESDFQQIALYLQTHIGAYFDVMYKNDKRIPQAHVYRVGGKYNDELSVSLYWLQKAHDHVIKFPEQFDNHMYTSLDLLCQYLQTGNEELFKQHSIEWLKTNSKVDYNFGFIETYQDPKSYRGTFQAEATIKSVDINKLNAVLPALEKRLPFPEKFKREKLDDLSSMPNASINTKVFTTGHLGPANITLAYALPNYADIRSKHGTKQIIYEPEKSLEQRINPKLSDTLKYTNEHNEWIAVHDPDGNLRRDIFTLHVILHETLGHGSGKLDKHTFVEGEPLTIEGKTYKAGDTIPVTSSNIQQFLAGYDAALEELRAEIIALYSSINGYDEIVASGLLGDWSQKINKEKMIELFILDMAYFGLQRLLRQPNNATQIFGAHAQANTTILNTLIDNGGIEIIEEYKTIDDNTYTVVALKVADLKKAQEAIKNLAILVQEIKSTGNGLKAQQLIDTLGKPIRNKEHMKILKENQKAIIGDLKVSAMLFPHFDPVVDENGNIVDIDSHWPENIAEQNKKYKKNQLSYDL